MFNSVRLAGAAYLIFLGFRAFCSVGSGGILAVASDPEINGPGGKDIRLPDKSSYISGLSIAMTNPKAILFFGSILTAFIPPDASAVVLVMIVAEIGILSLVLNTMAALFFSNPVVLRGFQTAGPVMSVVFGVLFCGLGASVAFDALKDFGTV